MKKINNMFWVKRLVLFLTTVLSSLLFLSIDVAYSRVNPPVKALIYSSQNIEINIPMNFTVQLEGEVSNASFEIFLPEGWTYVGGQTSWAGDLTMGNYVIFEFSLIPNYSSPNLPYGILRVPGWNDTEFSSFVGVPEQ
jgi:hypothetical protein